MELQWQVEEIQPTNVQTTCELQYSLITIPGCISLRRLRITNAVIKAKWGDTEEAQIKTVLIYFSFFRALHNSHASISVFHSFQDFYMSLKKKNTKERVDKTWLIEYKKSFIIVK